MCLTHPAALPHPLECIVPFDVITDYIVEARILLQDVDPPYRYLDSDLVLAFNAAVMESRKLRPDMWLGCATLPAFYAITTSTETASGNTLNFAAVPAAIVAGMSVFDSTTQNVIQPTNTVNTPTSNSVALASNVAGPVAAGDTIIFGPSGPVPIDPQYRMAFVYYLCGNAQLRDEEETQDTRAAFFMQAFKQSLVTPL